MQYNWQQPDWPNFRYELAAVEGALLAFADKAGQVSGVLKSLPDTVAKEAVMDVMIAEAVKSSEIEGQFLSRKDVMSSIRNQLGLNTPPEGVHDKASQGAAELMVDVRKTWDEPLTEKSLFAWHRMLFRGESGKWVGKWRSHTEPMQVVSGAVGKQKVHYEAPPSAQVPAEMKAFVRWFRETRKTIPQAPVRSALTHLYFESVHPFEDGNGRIGRALSEKALSQGLGRPALLSLSRTIEANKSAYYSALETAQKSNDVTPWVNYFVQTVLAAQTEAEERVDFVLRKTRLFDRVREQLSDRQLKVVRRMLDAGPEGFQGGMNAAKYMSLTKVSKATSTRDLQALVELGVFQSVGAGRTARYELML
ncbi:Fic family protein [Ruficoccus amylovorans]|uniref:Fic family protein n=1 Tax=Ruficoccus amylovorans TaxID=1804625 RepID=A0A842H9Q5_9BACT|nr:Fic family protein [Ruficoccus amylovorans]MBC2592838.1 Fic family protein [Ruficoccus amylovorans]